MKLKVGSILCVLGLLLVGQVTFAAGITCKTSQNKNNITISGVISEQTEVCNVTLAVGGRDNIVYVDQTRSSANGEFDFNFLMPQNIGSGTYEFEIGSDTGEQPYCGMFQYVPPKVKCDSVKVVNRDITISGTVENSIGASVFTLLVGGRNNVIYADQIKSSEKDKFEFNFTMPEGIQYGTYEFEIGSNTYADKYQGSFVYGTEPEDIYSGILAEKTITGSAGQTFDIIINGDNIKSFEDRVFTLTYNPEHIHVVTNVQEDTPDKKYGKSNMILFSEGEIRFAINSEYINGQNQWSGAADIFKFQYNSDYSGETTFYLSYTLLQ